MKKTFIEIGKCNREHIREIEKVNIKKSVDSLIDSSLSIEDIEDILSLINEIRNGLVERIAILHIVSKL